MEDLIGISKETMDKATGEVGKEFEALPSRCYKGAVKSIQIYTNDFGSKSMRYIVAVTTKDGEERDLKFSNDINSMLKGDVDNVGYANRMKEFIYATNADSSTFSKKDNAGNLNSFGKKYEYDELLGLNSKPLMVEVMLRNDINKAEGAPYKYDNVIKGVLALDGTDSTGENKAEKFNEKITKTPIEEHAGYVKKSSTYSSTTTEEADVAKAQAKASNF